MGTGIGIDCKVCEEQLNYDDGFDSEKQICNDCKEKLPKFLKYLLEKENKNG